MSVISALRTLRQKDSGLEANEDYTVRYQLKKKKNPK
jgi:hypothetical protein